MAVVTSWYTMDNKLGVDLNFVQTSVTITNDPSVPAPRAKLGDRVQGNLGSEWVFVIASATVTQNMLIAINGSYACTDLTSALVVSQIYFYGVAQFQSTLASPGDNFWALLKADSGVGINVASSVQANANVYIASGTPGAITSSVTSDALNGIQVLASIGTSASGPVEARIFTYIFPAQNMNVIGAIGSA